MSCMAMHSSPLIHFVLDIDVIHLVSDFILTDFIELLQGWLHRHLTHLFGDHPIIDIMIRGVNFNSNFIILFLLFFFLFFLIHFLLFFLRLFFFFFIYFFLFLFQFLLFLFPFLFLFLLFWLLDGFFLFVDFWWLFFLFFDLEFCDCLFETIFGFLEGWSCGGHDGIFIFVEFHLIHRCLFWVFIKLLVVLDI